MTTLETLRAARARTADTWPFGGCVAVQFVNVLNSGATSEAQEAFARVLGLPDATLSLYAWNDKPCRTKAEVLAAFDRAISYEEAREQEHAWRAFLPAPLELVPA